MNLDYKTILIFPVPIHQIDVNGFKEIENEFIDYCYDMQKLYPIGESFSNKGGSWQSPPLNVTNKDDLIQNLLINCLSEFTVLKKSTKLYISAWIGINKPGSYNSKHVHPRSDLSGVLWIKTPENCGNIVFDSPVAFQTHQETESYTDEFLSKTNYNHNYYFNPIKGRMLIFPSHLEHSVDPSESDEDRISVSFNIRIGE